MTCDDYQELASQFIDGELHDDQAGRLFSHVTGCTGCRQFMQSALQIRTATVQTPVVPVPSTLDERVRTIWDRRLPVRSHLNVRELWKRRFLVPAPALVSAGLMLLVAVMISIVSLTKTPRQGQEAMTKAAYIVTLPAVEVQGTYPVEQNTVH